jgi:eukaryotic-like serine/threonine-protein kinase
VDSPPDAAQVCWDVRMPSARTPRGTFSARGTRRAGRGRAGPPPEVADLLSDRGWALVEQDGRRPGAVGPRWVVADADGTRRDVGIVPVPSEASSRADLIERIDLLRSLDHEHLARVEEVVEVGPGLLALVSRRPQGEALPVLMGCRGPLDAGEGVTLLAPAARALAVLHAAGLAYGGIEASDLVVGPAGQPVLRAPLDLRAQPAADDVRSLAEVVAGLLPAESPSAESEPSGPAADPRLKALRSELVSGRHSDPRARPEIGTLAARCHDAAPPTPIAMPDGARLAAAALGARWAAQEADAEAPLARPSSRVGVEGVGRGGARRSSGDDSEDASGRRARPRVRVGVSSGEPKSGRSGLLGVAATRTPGARSAPRDPAVPRRPRTWGPGPETAVLVRHPVARAGLVLAVCLALSVAGVLVRAQMSADDVSSHEGPVADGQAGGRVDDAASDPTRRAGSPGEAAAELTERRIELLTGGRDPGEVLAPGSPAEALDLELLAELAADGLRIEGAHATVAQTRAVTPDAPGAPDVTGGPAVTGRPGVAAEQNVDSAAEPALGDEVQVEVTYTVSEHVQRAADGSTTLAPARGPTAATLTLRWTEVGWRVSEVG